MVENDRVLVAGPGGTEVDQGRLGRAAPGPDEAARRRRAVAQPGQVALVAQPLGQIVPEDLWLVEWQPAALGLGPEVLQDGRGRLKQPLQLAGGGARDDRVMEAGQGLDGLAGVAKRDHADGADG